MADNEGVAGVETAGTVGFAVLKNLGMAIPLLTGIVALWLQVEGYRKDMRAEKAAADQLVLEEKVKSVVVDLFGSDEDKKSVAAFSVRGFGHLGLDLILDLMVRDKLGDDVKSMLASSFLYIVTNHKVPSEFKSNAEELPPLFWSSFVAPRDNMQCKSNGKGSECLGLQLLHEAFDRTWNLWQIQNVESKTADPKKLFSGYLKLVQLWQSSPRLKLNMSMQSADFETLLRSVRLSLKEPDRETKEACGTYKKQCAYVAARLDEILGEGSEDNEGDR